MWMFLGAQGIVDTTLKVVTIRQRNIFTYQWNNWRIKENGKTKDDMARDYAEGEEGNELAILGRDVCGSCGRGKVETSCEDHGAHNCLITPYS